MRSLLYSLFFLSGAAGLIYEITWTRQLTLQLGVTAEAVATVLAVYMAGLAIGGAIAHRFIQKRNPLRFYAICEFAIAATGLLAAMAPAWLADVWIIVHRSFGDESAAPAWIRPAIAGATLLPPTLLMGMTLPALARAAGGAGGTIARSTGRLYAWNTAGAIAGVFCATFFCIEWFGHHRTVQVAAAINVVVGAIAWMLSTKCDFINTPGEPAGHELSRANSGAVMAALILTFAGGFVSLSCQSLWTRYLVYAVGDNSAFAFAEMLIIFLAGIALGSAVASPIAMETRRPLELLSILQILAAAACAAGPRWLDPAGRAAGFADPVTGEITRPFIEFVFHGLTAAAKVMALPTLLFGASFPLVVRVVTDGTAPDGRSAGVARDVGHALAWNTAGAIPGALAGGFLILPKLGYTNGLAVAGALLAVPSLGVLVGSARSAVAKAGYLLAGSILFGATVWYGSGTGDAAARALIRNSERDRLIYYEDTAVASIGVVEDTVTGSRILYVGGDAQASTDPGGMLHLRLLGHLPAAFHGDPKDALVVACGAGVTLGALATHPLKSLTICDLSEAVIRINRDGMFDSGNGGVFRDPRLSVVIQDGRNYLLTTERTFDLITTDPIDPDDAGVTSIYSREYYQLVNRRLREGGVACQWISTIYSLDVYKSLLAAFQSVFEECYLYDAGFTTVIVGRKRGAVRPGFARLEAVFSHSKARQSLAAVGIDGPFDLLSLQIAGPAELAAFCKDAVPNSDDRPVVETAGPRSLFGSAPGSNREKEGRILELRTRDRRQVYADFDDSHQAAFDPVWDAVSAAFAVRLLPIAPGAASTLPAEKTLASFGGVAPRFVEIFAGFDAVDQVAGPGLTEYYKNMTAGIDAWFQATGTPGARAAAARDAFAAALALRRDALRPRLGLAIACHGDGDPAAAMEHALILLKRARYAEFHLTPFCKVVMDALIELADDPKAGATVRASLARLSGGAAPDTKTGYAEWWARHRGRARIDGTAGRWFVQ